MESDHYIDSLRVDLTLPAASTPAGAQDEADALVDGHVVPAVESVIEALGQDFDANIPFLEVDVGRVRAEDLRDAVEAALRNALEKYRTSPEPPVSSSLDSLRAYLETGVVPWENGKAPFDPYMIVNKVLRDNPTAVLGSVDSFSEKELASLWLVVGQSFEFEGADSASASVSVSSSVSASASAVPGPSSQLREAILARLVREFPETASMLTGRVERWRAYLAQAGSSIEGERGGVDHPAEEKQEAVENEAKSFQPERDELDRIDIPIPPRSLRFKYIEVAVGDVPEGRPVVSMAFLENPGVQDPEYIRLEGEPLRFFRKVAIGPEEESIAGKAVEDLSEKPQIQHPVVTAEGIRTVEPELPHSALAEMGNGGPGLGGIHPGFRYVEISLRDIPEGHPVEAMDYSESADEEDPEYIMVYGEPLRYFKKVEAGMPEDRTGNLGPIEPIRDQLTEKNAVAIETKAAVRGDKDVARATAVPGEATEQWDERRFESVRHQEEASGLKEREKQEVPARQEKPARQDLPRDFRPEVSAYPESAVEDTDTDSGVEATGPIAGNALPETESRTFHYVEISLSDIPEGHPVEVMDYTENPGQDDPVYIMSSGLPWKYYRKVMSGTADVEVRRGEKRGEVESETLRSEGASRPSRYAEVNRESPESFPVEKMDDIGRPAGDDSEFVAIPGPPKRYFERQAVETGVDSGPKDDREIPDNPEKRAVSSVSSTLDIWEVQDFESEVTEERFPVRDAGLVLLHPFIARMMENLGLVTEGVFVSPLAQMRAVHLLRDLTKVEEPHYNHTLILEKILCGLPVGYTIPPKWEPTEKEKEETEALLQAVCSYWKPLSGSSTDALCGSFIRRPGTVERFEDSWIVRVEGHTIDILLDDLPWALSIVYLPWLENALAVEWQRE